MISYGHQWITQDDIDAVVKVLKSDYLTQGPAVSQFEKDLCELTGAKYCVSTSNATSGLHIAVAALMAVDAENDKAWGSDAEGVTTPITFLASANCMEYCGIKPVFADIDEKTYDIDPTEIEKHVNGKTKVLVPVHFAGQPCDMVRISSIAKKNGLHVIEDAAHAIGSLYKDGTPVGNCKYSDLTVFSFHPVKTITTGEGGAVMTNDEKLYQKLLMLRSHGETKDPALLTKNPGPWYYEMQMEGYNYRMTDMQAALGSSQLKRLASFKSRRREIIAQYNEAFKNCKHVHIPYETPGVSSCFHLYAPLFDFEAIGKKRKEVMADLRAKGLGTQVHYIPVCDQPFYKEHYGYKEGDYPKAEYYYEHELSLPLYPLLTDEQVGEVVRLIKEEFGEE